MNEELQSYIDDNGWKWIGDEFFMDEQENVLHLDELKERMNNE